MKFVSLTLKTFKVWCEIPDESKKLITGIHFLSGYIWKRSGNYFFWSKIFMESCR